MRPPSGVAEAVRAVPGDEAPCPVCPGALAEGGGLTRASFCQIPLVAPETLEGRPAGLSLDRTWSSYQIRRATEQGDAA
ncbi:hypothetical protein ROHU_004036 [Labeo rohita]|uniref:Uncharacterized protein n=1 Tax=Labeo rohita TaxID=84645 RepID=A0A498NR43_LABRO|nr:hypothetical protein ROHU_004036 [Labeo rohita]